MKSRFIFRVRKIKILIQWLTMQIQTHQERIMQIQTNQKLIIQSKTKLHIRKRFLRWEKANENAKFTNQSYYYSNNHVHTFSKLNKKLRNRFQSENENIFVHFSIFDDWTSKSTKFRTRLQLSRCVYEQHFEVQFSHIFREIIQIFIELSHESNEKKYERLSIRVFFNVNWNETRKLCIYFQFFKFLSIIWSHCTNSLAFFTIVFQF